MRLYSLTDATKVDDPVYGQFTAGPNGEFDFPNELSEALHSFPGWEDDTERATRLAVEELERLRDPKTLLAAIEAMSQNQQAMAAAIIAGKAAPAEAAPADSPPAPIAKADTPAASPPAPVAKTDVPASPPPADTPTRKTPRRSSAKAAPAD
jgi:hypothetical protein